MRRRGLLVQSRSGTPAWTPSRGAQDLRGRPSQVQFGRRGLQSVEVHLLYPTVSRNALCTLTTSHQPLPEDLLRMWFRHPDVMSTCQNPRWSPCCLASALRQGPLLAVQVPFAGPHGAGPKRVLRIWLLFSCQNLAARQVLFHRNICAPRGRSVRLPTVREPYQSPIVGIVSTRCDACQEPVHFFLPSAIEDG